MTMRRRIDMLTNDTISAPTAEVSQRRFLHVVHVYRQLPQHDRPATIVSNTFDTLYPRNPNNL